MSAAVEILGLLAVLSAPALLLLVLGLLKPGRDTGRI